MPRWSPKRRRSMRATSLKFHSVPALAPEPRPEGASRAGSLWNCWTLVAMSLGYGVVQLDVTIVNTALAAIGTSLGGGVSGLPWVGRDYTIAFADFILTA